MKKIEIDLRKFQKSNKGSSWQKAVLVALIIGSVIVLLAYIYLALKPIPKEIKVIIDDEISAVDISFDQSVIESIKERQKPADFIQSVSGKNPFSGL